MLILHAVRPQLEAAQCLAKKPLWILAFLRVCLAAGDVSDILEKKNLLEQKITIVLQQIKIRPCLVFSEMQNRKVAMDVKAAHSSRTVTAGEAGVVTLEERTCS